MISIHVCIYTEPSGVRCIIDSPSTPCTPQERDLAEVMSKAMTTALANRASEKGANMSIIEQDGNNESLN